MIDRNAQIESALVVERQHLIDRVRGFVLADIGEGAAVAECGESGPLKGIEPEEAADTEAKETVALREGVPAGSIDQSLERRTPL